MRLYTSSSQVRFHLLVEETKLTKVKARSQHQEGVDKNRERRALAENVAGDMYVWILGGPYLRCLDANLREMAQNGQQL